MLYQTKIFQSSPRYFFLSCSFPSLLSSIQCTFFLFLGESWWRRQILLVEYKESNRIRTNKENNARINYIQFEASKKFDATAGLVDKDKQEEPSPSNLLILPFTFSVYTRLLCVTCKYFLVYVYPLPSWDRHGSWDVGAIATPIDCVLGSTWKLGRRSDSHADWLHRGHGLHHFILPYSLEELWRIDKFSEGQVSWLWDEFAEV